MEIRDFVRRFGITINYKGHKYLVYAISLSMSDEYRNAKGKDIFDATAIHFNCSRKMVDRNIRTLVERAYKINPDLLFECAGCILHKAPTNYEFIKIIAKEIEGEAYGSV